MSINPGCKFTAVPCIFTDIEKLHQINYECYLSQMKLSKSASRNDELKSLESSNKYSEQQDELFDTARVKRNQLDSRSIERIGRSARDVFPSDTIKAFGRMFQTHLEKLCSDDEYSCKDAVVELIRDAETLKSRLTLLRDIASKTAFFYGRTSSRKSHTFRDDFVDAEKLMGEHGALLSPNQVMNGIASIKVLHNQSVLSSNKLVIFHDNVTRRDVICKKKLMAFILCNIFFDNIFAVVNELSRFGSDPAFVNFILEILKYRGKRVIIAAQLDFDPDEIIKAEYDRKISLAMYEGKRIADEKELIYSIPDENLSRQQQIIGKIVRNCPRRKDYDELIEVMGVPFEQRRMYSDKELAVFKPKPLSGNNFTNMQVVRRNVQPTRVIPASTYQTELNPIPTDKQHIQQNKNSQPAKVIPTRNVK